MSFYRGLTATNVTITGDKGTPITAYVAKPEGPGPLSGVVLIHHLPGWSEFYIETTRRFAHHGYITITANLYECAGDGNPDDVATKVRAEGMAKCSDEWFALTQAAIAYDHVRHAPQGMSSRSTSSIRASMPGPARVWS